MSKSDRTAKEFKYIEVNQKISFGGNNSAINSMYSEILAENNKLIASAETYDEIGSDGKLYLNGEYINRELFKHVFSDGLYGGNIADSEQAVKKEIKLNNISNTNYITDKYTTICQLQIVNITQWYI